MNHTSELNSQQVVNYLQAYPDFFNQHLELLETLIIPHPTNEKVVSLVAKQLEVLRNKQAKLEQQLNSLLEIARDNDVCAGRMHQLTLALLGAPTLEAAVHTLKQTLTAVFLTDFVALKIIAANPNPVLSDFFIPPAHEDAELLTAELSHQKPRCGRLNVAQTKFLFADAAPQIKSCAIIPILHSDLTALLVIGSRDEDRFHYSMGDLFLMQLGEIVGIRLATLLRQ